MRTIKRISWIIILMLFTAGCRGLAPSPTGTPITPSPTQIHPSETIPLAPTPTTVQPTITITLPPTATYDLSNIWLPEKLFINVDGFACAAAMSINLIGVMHEGILQDEVLCDDIGVYMHHSVGQQMFPTISDFFVFNVGSYLEDTDIPISIYLDTSLDYDLLQSYLHVGKIPVAVVFVNEMWHAIFIVGYIPYGGGYAYLDSLYEMGEEIPDENDFFDRYGITFTDAWRATFVLEFAGEEDD
jgi:hypothetical protein